jgi:ATP adenylyltransferase
MTSKKKQTAKRTNSSKKGRIQVSRAETALNEIQANIWPQERDFFERPDRLRYVRQVIKHENCVFCEAQKRGTNFESLILWMSPHTVVIMNKYPYNTGHLLVLPHRHLGDFQELEDGEYTEMMKVLRLSTDIVRKAYSCAGFNIGLNHGKIAGAGLPEHLHWHIIPRWHGDTNFFPLIAETKVLPETIEQSYYILKPNFDKLVL